jgi:hypothetical protein
VNHSCPNVTGFVPEKSTPRHERYETPIEGSFVTGFVPCPGQFVGKSFVPKRYRFRALRSLAGQTAGR